MTDRERLELAAKAAGIVGTLYDDGISVVEKIGDKFHSYIWNPLTDDGDALRPAVKLGIKLNPDNSAEIGAHKFGSFDKSRNPYAATRRAIVRAAAEIGRAMP